VAGLTEARPESAAGIPRRRGCPWLILQAARLRPQSPLFGPDSPGGGGIYQSNSKSPGKAVIWRNPGLSLTIRAAGVTPGRPVEATKPRYLARTAPGPWNPIKATAKAPERP